MGFIGPVGDSNLGITDKVAVILLMLMVSSFAYIVSTSTPTEAVGVQSISLDTFERMGMNLGDVIDDNTGLTGLMQSDLDSMTYAASVSMNEAQPATASGNSSYHDYVLTFQNPGNVITPSVDDFQSTLPIYGIEVFPQFNPREAYQNQTVDNCTDVISTDADTGEEVVTQDCQPYEESVFVGTQYDDGDITDTIDTNTSLVWTERIYFPPLAEGTFNQTIYVDGGEYLLDPSVTACQNINAAGTYTVTSELSYTGVGACINVTHADVSIDGQGHNLSGDNTSASIGINVTAADVNISNFNAVKNSSIDIAYRTANSGNVNNVTLSITFANGQAIVVNNSNKTVINGSTITGNTSSFGILIANNSLNSTVANNSVAVATNSAVEVQNNSNNTLIKNNTLNTTTGNVVRIEIGSTVFNTSIINNSLNSTSGNGLNPSGASNSSFINNTQYCNAGGCVGLTASGTIDWWTIFNNTFIPQTSTGRFMAIAAAANNWNISNNLINQTGNSPMSITGDLKNFTFANNELNTTCAACSLMAQRGNNWTFTNNTFNMSGVTQGVLIESAATNFTNSTISNNTVWVGGAAVAAGAAFVQLSIAAVNVTYANNTFTAKAGTAQWYGLRVNNSNVTQINFTGNNLNVSGAGAYGVHLSLSTLNNSITNNSIWVNTTNGTAFLADSTSGNNVIYYNNFTGGQFFINNSNSTNTFNTTVGGVGQGNNYSNITSYAIYDSMANGWGDIGSQYPANATNTGGIFASGSVGNDSGPWTSLRTAYVSALNLSPAGPSCTAVITCNLTAISNPNTKITLNYTWMKNSVIQHVLDTNNTIIDNNTVYLANYTLGSGGVSTVNGDNWSCNITSVNDSLAWSGPNVSNNVTTVCGAGPTLTGPVGGPLGFLWQIYQTGNLIMRGGPQNWNWSVYNPGDNVLVPNGTSQSWSWTGE